jgi:intracellular sulfur oxidation DsrE/DsrF family protein
MSGSGKPLHIDIPVKLSDVRTVYSIGALTFEGDLPASIFHLQLITNDIADSDAKSEVVAVFHTNAGHVTLHDAAYNAERNIDTGNPYKNLVVDLINRGVRVELCGATAKAHHWGNADLLPNIKGQHGCHGEDDTTRSARIRQNNRISPKIRGAKNERIRHPEQVTKERGSIALVWRKP